MIIGHYASALIARSREPSAPFALLLACAILQDGSWLVFALLGWEPTLPASIFDASFSRLSVEMTYSHDAISAVGWMLVAAALGWLVTRRGTTALWCAALSAGHELLDLLSGFTHHMAGPSTPAIGLNLYGSAPYLAITIEAAFGAGMVYLYGWSEAHQGRALPARKRASLYAVFVLGALVLLPGAERSLSDWLR
jgi:hypothetical protein